jgi:hypothetical protein
MSYRAKAGIAASAVIVALLGARPGDASSVVRGIPVECQLDSYRVGVGSADGRVAPTTPVSFASTLVIGQWAQKGYHLSHDGKTMLVYTFDGFNIVKGNAPPASYEIALVYKNVLWGPDNKKFMFWTPEGVTLADVEALGPPNAAPSVKVLYPYKTRPGHRPFSAAWSPTGNEVYVLEHYEEASGGKTVEGSAMLRVTLDGAATEILNHPTRVYWFMYPSSRFEDGSGPSGAPFRLVFGAMDGIWVMNPDGSEQAKLCDLTPEGFDDIVFSPDPKKEKFAFRMRQPQVAPDKKTYTGVYVAHLDRWKKGTTIELEQVHDKPDVHTLWCSPKGRFVTWASADEVGYRELDGKPDSTIKVDVPGRVGPITGCTWDRAETRLAITAGNRLYIHDVAKKTVTEVAKVGEASKSFLADPVWCSGEEVVVGLFTDVTPKEPAKK